MELAVGVIACALAFGVGFAYARLHSMLSSVTASLQMATANENTMVGMFKDIFVRLGKLEAAAATKPEPPKRGLGVREE